MADQSDVEAALVAAISQAVYPNGVGGPSAVGALCRVYRGWPQSLALESDLAAGVVNISVFPVSGTTRYVPRLKVAWQQSTQKLKLSLKVHWDRLEICGEVTPSVTIGLVVDGKPYRYLTRAGDTPRSVIEALAGLVRVDREALVLDNTVRIPGTRRLTARAAVDVMGFEEIRRQSVCFRVTLWCPTPQTRDQVSAFVDLALAGMVFLELGDGSTARLVAQGGDVTDMLSDATLYRRELTYRAEFATVARGILPTMLFGSLDINDLPETIV